MDKLSYIDFINLYQNEETICLIGKIDTQFLETRAIECLYYAFPLIERMVLEIFKLIPESDIEHVEQGIMKTVIAIIEANKEFDILPKYIIKLIYKYFDGDCIRNELYHAKETKFEVEVSFLEINFLIMKLLKILKLKIKECNNYKIKPISLLE